MAEKEEKKVEEGEDEENKEEEFEQKTDLNFDFSRNSPVYTL